MKDGRPCPFCEKVIPFGTNPYIPDHEHEAECERRLLNHIRRAHGKIRCDKCGKPVSQCEDVLRGYGAGLTCTAPASGGKE